MAEGGSTVELFRNGLSRGTVAASPSRLILSPLSVATGSSAGSVSPNGAQFAGFRADAQGRPVLFIETFSSHALVSFATPAGYSIEAQPPVWSPDGSRLALRGTRLANGKSAVLIAAVATGTLSGLPTSIERGELNPSFSADSRYLAFKKEYFDNFITVVALSTGIERDSPPGFTQSFWRPDGTLLALLPQPDGSARAFRLDFTTWVSAEAGALSSFSSAALDSTGRWLAYTDGSARSVSLLDLSSGAQRVLTASASTIPSNLSWAPDGSVLSFTANGTLYRAEPTGPAVASGPIGSGRIVHLTASEYLFDNGIAPQRGTFAGDFVFAATALDLGVNVFDVIARDASGNSSPRSETISVTRTQVGAVNPASDLSVSLQLQPAVIQPGDPVTAIVTVRNAGPGDVLAPAVAVTLAKADGTLVALPQIRLAGTLGVGSSQTVLAVVSTTGLSGAGHNVMVTVDPALETNDVDRTNNRAAAPLAVATPGALPVVSLSLGASELNASGSTTATIAITNPGAPTFIEVSARLLDGTGAVVTALGAAQSYNPLAGSSTTTLMRLVSAAGLAPGDYQVEVRATSGTTLVSQAVAPVRVLADRTAHVALSARRAAWNAGETVVLDAVVFNDSVNASLTAATLRLQVAGTLDS